MNRAKENEILIDNLRYKFKECAKTYSGITRGDYVDAMYNLFIDISKSLAVIADTLQEADNEPNDPEH